MISKNFNMVITTIYIDIYLYSKEKQNLTL